MYDFGVPEIVEVHPVKGWVSAAPVIRESSVCPEWEREVSVHVEALKRLGWRWEGRGLTPTLNAWNVSDVVSCDNVNHSSVANETLQRCQQSS